MPAYLHQLFMEMVYLVNVRLILPAVAFCELLHELLGFFYFHDSSSSTIATPSQRLPWIFSLLVFTIFSGTVDIDPIALPSCRPRTLAKAAMSRGARIFHLDTAPED